MADDIPDPWPIKAYKNNRFLDSRDGRILRIMSEYAEPEARFRHYDVADTIVFFGSARIKDRETAEAELRAAREGSGDVARAEHGLELSRYYEAARELAGRLTTWSKELSGTPRRFLVCSGGGPGIMEAANRGASEARGLNVGLNITLPHEQIDNPYISRELCFEFHYFFMRKFWFLYLAKGLVVFPGGFGTMDEFFETLTLVQTGKLRKPMPTVLYGSAFWNEVLNLEAMVKWGTIERRDLELFQVVDSVDDAFAFMTSELLAKALHRPGGEL